MLGDSVQQSKLEVLRAQTATFREKLEEFALSHKCVWLLTHAVYRAVHDRRRLQK